MIKLRIFKTCFGLFSQEFYCTVGCQRLRRTCEKLQVFSGLEGY